MTDITPNSISLCLNQQGFEIRDLPSDGRQGVIEPGFYFDTELCRIEHFSQPCEYTYAMIDHFSNQHGLINDGFINVLAFDDIDHLSKNMHNWKNYLADKLSQ